MEICERKERDGEEGGVIRKVVSHAGMHLYLRYRSYRAICDRSVVSIMIVNVARSEIFLNI